MHKCNQYSDENIRVSTAHEDDVNPCVQQLKVSSAQQRAATQVIAVISWLGYGAVHGRRFVDGGLMHSYAACERL